MGTRLNQSCDNGADDVQTMEPLIDYWLLHAFREGLGCLYSFDEAWLIDCNYVSNDRVLKKKMTTA